LNKIYSNNVFENLGNVKYYSTLFYLIKKQSYYWKMRTYFLINTIGLSVHASGNSFLPKNSLSLSIYASFKLYL